MHRCAYVAGSCGLFKTHLKKKKLYSDMRKNKHIGLCRVSIHVVFVK